MVLPRPLCCNPKRTAEIRRIMLFSYGTAAPTRRQPAAPLSARSPAIGGTMQHAQPASVPPTSSAALFSLIGNTPMVEVTRIDTGPCQLFLKLESQNPGGSIKDRIGRAMIEAAERDGLLLPGGTVVEATAGNTGLGLALVARIKGYRVVLVVPDKMASEK